MHEFGAMQPGFMGKLLLLIVRIGFGRGKLKHYLGWLWHTLNLNSPVDVVYNGLRLRLFSHGNTIETKMLFSSRLREKLELKAIARHLNDGGVFIDIGANIGYYSLMMAQNAKCRIFAIEPNPELVKRLRQNAEFNGLQDKIEIWNGALGDSRGLVRLNLDNKDLGSSSIVNAEPGSTFINVELRPLVDILESASIDRIDALKIDVEGMEDKILRPFFETAPTFLYPSMVIIEDSSKAGWDWDVVAWMLSNGYSIINKSRGNLILEKQS